MRQYVWRRPGSPSSTSRGGDDSAQRIQTVHQYRFADGMEWKDATPSLNVGGISWYSACPTASVEQHQSRNVFTECTGATKCFRRNETFRRSTIMIVSGGPQAYTSHASTVNSSSYCASTLNPSEDGLHPCESPLLGPLQGESLPLSLPGQRFSPREVTGKGVWKEWHYRRS